MADDREQRHGNPYRGEPVPGTPYYRKPRPPAGNRSYVPPPKDSVNARARSNAISSMRDRFTKGPK